jgi:hypothetical protein
MDQDKQNKYSKAGKNSCKNKHKSEKREVWKVYKSEEKAGAQVRKR